MSSSKHPSFLTKSLSSWQPPLSLSQDFLPHSHQHLRLQPYIRSSLMDAAATLGGLHKTQWEAGHRGCIHRKRGRFRERLMNEGGSWMISWRRQLVSLLPLLVLLLVSTPGCIATGVLRWCVAESEEAQLCALAAAAKGQHLARHLSCVSRSNVSECASAVTRGEADFFLAPLRWGESPSPHQPIGARQEEQHPLQQAHPFDSRRRESSSDDTQDSNRGVFRERTARKRGKGQGEEDGKTLEGERKRGVQNGGQQMSGHDERGVLVGRMNEGSRGVQRAEWQGERERGAARRATRGLSKRRERGGRKVELLTRRREGVRSIASVQREGRGSEQDGVLMEGEQEGNLVRKGNENGETRTRLPFGVSKEREAGNLVSVASNKGDAKRKAKGAEVSHEKEGASSRTADLKTERESELRVFVIEFERPFSAKAAASNGEAGKNFQHVYRVFEGEVEIVGEVERPSKIADTASNIQVVDDALVHVPRVFEGEEVIPREVDRHDLSRDRETKIWEDRKDNVRSPRVFEGEEDAVGINAKGPALEANDRPLGMIVAGARNPFVHFLHVFEGEEKESVVAADRSARQEEGASSVEEGGSSSVRSNYVFEEEEDVAGERQDSSPLPNGESRRREEKLEVVHVPHGFDGEDEVQAKDGEGESSEILSLSLGCPNAKGPVRFDNSIPCRFFFSSKAYVR
eukprot:TRINITY_DN22156_c0_g1_i1.p1 TRINITY_DN22156_c0_g1~~TRINITY_DN22156_c0_g1_i1.p1  ORF type:complete len:688 (+),score=111.53 TRINITY_DN22156_c0_g1_i1:137-2200(+)